MSKIVILDAGHNELTTNGSPDGSYKEHEFNIYIKDRMVYHLNRHGIQTIFVDSKSSKSSTELAEIVNKANQSNGDIYVSLHSNAYGNGWTSPSGWEIFCYGTSKTSEGYKLAKCIHDASIPEIGLVDRGIKDGSNLYVVRKTTMPAVLIEHGFHTNKEEVAKLKDKNFREKLAICNVKGILNYFGIKWIEESTKLYKVQVGAFRSKTNAENLVKELKAKGYSAIIVEME